MLWTNSLVPTATTEWANTSGSNGYAIYPCAEVTTWAANGASGGALSNTATLSPNGVTWTNGDTVELPLHHNPLIKFGSFTLANLWAGTAQGLSASYYGVFNNTYGLILINGTPVIHYSNQGGTLGAPGGINLNGTWGAALTLNGGYDRKSVGLKWVNGPGGGVSSGYYLIPMQIWSSVGAGNDLMEYDQNTGTWYLTAGGKAGTYTFGANVPGGGFKAPGHIGSGTTDTQGTVTITSSTSATVNFSVAFSAYPICTVTPTSDPTSVGGYWVSATTHSAFTVNVHRSGTITFNYICMGNPN
jgi:hypothetical protein